MPRILIVEDTPLLSQAYRTIMLMEGFEVDTASNGQEALTKATGSIYNLILLDLFMPEMTGLEFMKAFDAPNKHRLTKIIVFSNSSSPDSIEEAQALGAARYLIKSSLSPKEMVAVVREVISENKEVPK